MKSYNNEMDNEAKSDDDDNVVSLVHNTEQTSKINLSNNSFYDATYSMDKDLDYQTMTDKGNFNSLMSSFCDQKGFISLPTVLRKKATLVCWKTSVILPPKTQ